MTSTASATFVDVLALRAESAALGRAIRIASVLFVAALTAAAAQISVPLPFTEVPFTFQPMVVLIGGLSLGSRLGLASQVLYLAAGIAGLPVFAASPALPPGMLRLLGPTGGYLMSYPIAAFAVGYLAERGFDRRYATAVLAMLIGLAIIYTSGVLWLGLFARTAAPIPIGIRRALMTGVVPFVVPDVLKLLAAAAVLPGIWNLIE
ncbi:MAG TPA: biotin transporter BioY, partial [Burkholderiales bacterium]|nr:biotin transporter BioY [Burkholderiales bacterium]